ncbi:hypothetical protein FIA58_011870 [Flavobacterium jejuense]|uniref:DUF4369 domain-containing protein n=1 Tax=Flavobacterium jejuense TaxID=1544455 RepID=A0ABX0IRB4_9FLAO|nr:hypothetical protein [Flavobacterium jejuense]NHN26375.1 hypothetical protein [Flavobacterium jejuense]
MKRKAQLAGIFTVILLVFTVGLKGTFDGYYGFYYAEKEYKKPLAFTLSEEIIKLKPVSIFLSYTGFDTGYSFFAPNVASDFVLLFELKDKEGNIIENRIMPRFKNKESITRYTSVYNMFLDKIAAEGGTIKDNKYQQYLDIIVKQIAIAVKKENPNTDQIIARLYLYHYPDLKSYQKGEKSEKLILIGEYK